MRLCLQRSGLAFLLAFLFVVAGCTPSPSGAESDAGSADGLREPDPGDAMVMPFVDAGGGEGGLAREGWCLPEPETVSDCTWDWPLFEDVILEAERFGEGSTFVALGRATLLVRGADDELRVFRLPGDFPFRSEPLGENPGEELESWSLPVRDWQLLRVPRGGGGGRYVLACEGLSPEGAGRDCTVFHAVHSEATLGEFPALPAGFEARGLFVHGHDGRNSVCAYGSGIICLTDDDWEPAIPNDESIDIRSVVLATSPLAVGSSGRRWQGEQQGEGEIRWHELPPLTHDLLHGVSRVDLMLAVHADGYYLSTENDELHCSVPGGLVGAWLIVRSAMFMLTADGQLWSYRDSGDNSSPESTGSWCRHEQMAMEVLLDVQFQDCNVNRNVWVLTPSTWVGQTECWTPS